MVGSENLQTPAGIPTHVRGDFVTWIDFNSSAPAITDVADVMNQPSARLANPRYKIKRWMNRPRDFFNWGTISATGGIGPIDPWHGTINGFGDNFTPSGVLGQQRYFFAQQMWKVVFRSRRIV